ncbi:hypothetical protein BCIN_03g08660 [Botrytis cinerea B05.10]|uniref:Uncharacterized protein n=1 Tax=Botryotinia fuckeliana (strain B05.10) TaxID=332648 RepID=A0A384JDW1_BOTFB|nr:hypothetical protein BCIN_03g08660 [Botrytis cinerea B05.10]ATZ48680.1 hypothetical protein BCIN_03g08660 [Botrytis cinerea B05.10]
MISGRGRTRIRAPRRVCIDSPLSTSIPTCLGPPYFFLLQNLPAPSGK